MAEEGYREFMCKLVYPGCDFAVRAKTDDEVIELARMHQEMAHGVKEISADLEKKIKANIRPHMTQNEPEKEEKKEEKVASVEPIKPGDSRVVRKSSLLDTCYTTSSGKK